MKIDVMDNAKLHNAICLYLSAVLCVYKFHKNRYMPQLRVIHLFLKTTGGCAKWNTYLHDKWFVLSFLVNS